MSAGASTKSAASAVMMVIPVSNPKSTRFSMLAKQKMKKPADRTIEVTSMARPDVSSVLLTASPMSPVRSK